LVGSDPRISALVGAMLRAGAVQGLVVTQVERLSDAVQELLRGGTHCTLVDLDGEAPDALEQLRAAAPGVAIVALTDHPDVTRTLAAITSGAQDCLAYSELAPTLLRRALLHAIERQRTENRLAHQALHDVLTGLPNRALFLDRLGVALDRSRRTRTSIAVMFLDVDNFREINNSLGHPAGDQVLAGLADRMRAMLRPMDTIARFGGDEFIFLFEDLASEREVVLIAERIRRAAADPVDVSATEVSITVSIGITMVTDPTIPPETVIREADLAMYRAKERGRARFELFDESSRERASERLELESQLRHALQRAQLRVHYQPTVSLRGPLEVVGFEALVRWDHPERGLIAPREFIRLAEDTGMIGAIGQFVLEEAVHQLARWRRSNPEITVSNNISARQLEDVGLPALLAGVVQAAGSVPGAICVEIAETALTADPESVMRSMSALKSVGVQLAIDDYGTGSSLLPLLRRLPIDILKIDDTVVRGVGSDHGETTIVGAVVDLGHALGLRVFAEGVETEEQLEQLQALGCDGAQGYLFSPPIPEDEADALLTAG
jgi:diguanylate cyclase (GGDEF)-like protein